MLISKSKFTVKECDADTDYCSVVAKGKNLEDAIEKAEKFEQKIIRDGSYIEYGIHFEK